MLYNILLFVLVIYLMISPIFYVMAIKFGIRIIKKTDEVINEPTVKLPKQLPKLPKKKKAPKMTAEQDRVNQILANVDRYDGTSKGQQKIVKR